MTGIMKADGERCDKQDKQASKASMTRSLPTCQTHSCLPSLHILCSRNTGLPSLLYMPKTDEYALALSSAWNI